VVDVLIYGEGFCNKIIWVIMLRGWLMEMIIEEVYAIETFYNNMNIYGEGLGVLNDKEERI